MSVTDQRPNTRPAVAIGDVVEVKSAEEILAELDERGELDSLPFMPEMLQFCGQRFVVDVRHGNLDGPAADDEHGASGGCPL